MISKVFLYFTAFIAFHFPRFIFYLYTIFKRLLTSEIALKKVIQYNCLLRIYV